MGVDEAFLRVTKEGCPARGERPVVLPATLDGGLLSVSGQTAVGESGELLMRGRLGVELSVEQGRACAWQCAVNVVAAAQQALGSLESVVSVRMVNIWVACTPDFFEQHLVADAATELFIATFGAEVGRHARAAIGVSALPTGSPVEVAATFRTR